MDSDNMYLHLRERRQGALPYRVRERLCKITVPAVHIDVWSDYVCPFCYLAEPTLARIEREFGNAISITWRAFELRPEPVSMLPPDGEYLHDIWARAVYPMAREREMTLRLPPVQPRSRLAHEAAFFAREHGDFNAMNNALFRAFFERGEDVGEVDVLAKVAVSAGLDDGGLRRALTEGSHREEVLGDERLAHDLQLSSVPAMLVRSAQRPLGEAWLLSGAQPYEVVHRAVTQLLEAVPSSSL